MRRPGQAVLKFRGLHQSYAEQILSDFGKSHLLKLGKGQCLIGIDPVVNEFLH